MRCAELAANAKTAQLKATLLDLSKDWERLGVGENPGSHERRRRAVQEAGVVSHQLAAFGPPARPQHRLDRVGGIFGARGRLVSGVKSPLEQSSWPPVPRLMAEIGRW
jgi:hypothetical protein